MLGTGFPLIKNTESLSAATTPERVISNANIDIKVYDINGREVDRIFSGYLSKGKYSMNWLADNQPSGVYFINMISDIRSTTKKVSLIK